MTATLDTSNRAPGYEDKPDHRVDFELTPRRVRVEFKGAMIADSLGAMIVLESGNIPVYYFPRKDVRLDLMSSTDQQSHCPFKGEASYRSVEVGGKIAKNAVWSYETPYQEFAPLKDYLAFSWREMDHWYEEDDEIFVHARNPYKRVDAIRSSRQVQIIVGGETVADSTNACFLFETGLPVRYYLPEADVRMDLLTSSETRSSCPYKGDAIYWSVNAGGSLHEDIVWGYPDPIPECPKIKNLMCFFNERIEDILVDGKSIPKVKTKWSSD